MEVILLLFLREMRERLVTVGSNQQPLDSKSNALPTELPREICGVGLNVYCTAL